MGWISERSVPISLVVPVISPSGRLPVGLCGLQRPATVHPKRHALFAWLEAKRTPTEAVRIIHNDFKLDNILVDRTSSTVAVALLDWDMVTLGDPYFDLATLLSYWVAPEDPSPLRAFNTTPSETPGALSRAALVEAYSRAIGVALDPERLLYFRVLAYAKLGVVLMQLDERYRGDAEAAVPHTQFAAAVVPAFEMGLRLTQGSPG